MLIREAIILCYPSNLKKCLLSLRNEKEQTPSAVKLEVPKLRNSSTTQGKKKEPKPPQVNQPPMMNFIIWNVRGANSANFRRHCTTMVKLYKPSTLILLETKMADHKRITKTLDFDHQL